MIFKVSLKIIPLVVISPTVLMLSALAIVLPERRKAVDKAATFFIISLYGEVERPSIKELKRRPRVTIVRISPLILTVTYRVICIRRPPPENMTIVREMPGRWLL